MPRGKHHRRTHISLHSVRGRPVIVDDGTDVGVEAGRCDTAADVSGFCDVGAWEREWVVPHGVLAGVVGSWAGFDCGLASLGLMGS